jgi:RimJ/RimL family protein N-acetyltransferase
VGIELGGADRIEIRVDVDNKVSCRIPRRLGYREEGVLRRRLPTHDGSPQRDAVLFSLFAEDLAASPAAVVPFTAFDCRGLPLA